MDYTIIRSNRRTISIQIKPDGAVVVRAPRRMHREQIEAFLRSKSRWIRKHLSSLPAANQPPFTEAEREALREQAREIITQRVAYFAPIIGVSYGRISIRTQRTRWGSCSSKGNLNFNCLLGLVPETVLDYVVVHELCHRKQMNHSAQFWAEVARVLPNYRETRLWLKENGSRLMARLGS